MTAKEFFERNKNIINRVVRGFLAKNKVGIVHGTRATNSQLPTFLNKKTQDWDVFVKKPKVRAMQVEQVLDKKFRSDAFRIVKGKGSPGILVYKVKSNVTNETFIDFAKPKRKVPSVAKRGVKFATLKDQKTRALENVRNPKLQFRREKDLNLLKRINKFEKIRGRKI